MLSLTSLYFFEKKINLLIFILCVLSLFISPVIFKIGMIIKILHVIFNSYNSWDRFHIIKKLENDAQEVYGSTINYDRIVKLVYRIKEFVYTIKTLAIVSLYFLSFILGSYWLIISIFTLCYSIYLYKKYTFTIRSTIWDLKIRIEYLFKK